MNYKRFVAPESPAFGKIGMNCRENGSFFDNR